MLDKLDVLEEAAANRRDAINIQSKAGEDFGEASGMSAARHDGLVAVLADGRPGAGSVDQAFKSMDNSELVIQETKGPSAGLGTRQVSDGQGGTVPATQGSEAYLRSILRADTKLREAIVADPALHQGLVDGTTSLRYRLVQPNAAGHVKVTEFLFNQAEIDIREWLEG